MELYHQASKACWNVAVILRSVLTRGFPIDNAISTTPAKLRTSPDHSIVSSRYTLAAKSIALPTSAASIGSTSCYVGYTTQRPGGSSSGRAKAQGRWARASGHAAAHGMTESPSCQASGVGNVSPGMAHYARLGPAPPRSDIAQSSRWMMRPRRWLLFNLTDP